MSHCFVCSVSCNNLVVVPPNMAPTTWVYGLSRIELEDELNVRGVDAQGPFAMLRSRLVTFVQQQPDTGMLGYRLIQRLPTRMDSLRGEPTLSQAPSMEASVVTVVNSGATVPRDPIVTRESDFPPIRNVVNDSDVLPGTLGTHAMPALTPVVPGAQPVMGDASLAKVNRTVVTDMIAALPMVDGRDSVLLCRFLVQATSIYDLDLMPLHSYVLMLVSRTSGQLSQEFITIVRRGHSWERFCQGVLEFACPYLIREDLTMSYITRRFQSATESFDTFVNDIFLAARVLGYGEPEVALVDLCLRNMLSSNKVHLTFLPRPTTRVALKAVGVELQHALFLQQVANAHSAQPSPGEAARQRSLVHRGGREGVSNSTANVCCWICGVWGHRKDRCPTRTSTGRCVPPPSGNANRARH